MFWSGLTELPWFWAPFANPIFAIVAALLIPTLLAALLGYLIFRSRVQGVYFSIITQALTLLTSIWFVGQQAYTGGTNGITDLGQAKLFGQSLQSDGVKLAFYFASVVCWRWSTSLLAGWQIHALVAFWWHCVTTKIGCAFSATTRF